MSTDGHEQKKLMTGSEDRFSGSATSVVRQIDQELNRLRKYEVVLAAERELLLSARSALTNRKGARSPRRGRVSQGDVAAYLAEHPGCFPAQIAAALQAPATNVSAHLYRGRHTCYERREDGWHLRGERSVTEARAELGS